MRKNFKNSNKHHPVTTYVPVSHHIYYDGFSFRVRVIKDGESISVSTSDKRKALKLRDKLLK